MLIQKLRLQHGWSQQQLAEMSGLSTRTIQRIENEQRPSIESVKSLAAVFEVDFSTLQGAMPTDIPEILPQAEPKPVDNKLILTDAEKTAYKKVRKIKKFYRRLLIFILIMLFSIDLLTSPDIWWVQWVFLGWGIGITIKGLDAFDFLPFFNADWENRKVKKYMQ